MKSQYIGKIFGLIAATAFVAAGLTTANASLVNITTPYLPDLHTVSGHAAPTVSQPLAEKSTSQGDAELFAWLQGQVPGSDPAPVNNILANGTSTSVGDLSSYVGDYLVVHWGNGSANKFFDPNPQGGFDQVFFITGTGLGNVTLTIPTISGYYINGGTVKNGTIEVGALSFWRVYAVPEPTTMIAGGLLLLPFGASVLRKLRKNRTA